MQNIGLLIADEIQQVGGEVGPTYEVVEICVVPNKSSDTYCCVWCVACQCGGFG